MARETFIVIPVHNRREMLWDLILGLKWPADHVILIDNNSVPPLSDDFSGYATIATFEERNIQAMWNAGWEMASIRATGPYAVAFLNSDLNTGQADILRLVDALDAHRASVTFPDHCKILSPGAIHRNARSGPAPWNCRMTGYSFVVRGELGSRFDEDFVWWYGDDDFEWRAREEFGGSVMVAGIHAYNRDANGAQRDYPELNAQCDKDRVNFINKWGRDSQ